MLHYCSTPTVLTGNLRGVRHIQGTKTGTPLVTGGCRVCESIATQRRARKRATPSAQQSRPQRRRRTIRSRRLKLPCSRTSPIPRRLSGGCRKQAVLLAPGSMSARAFPPRQAQAVADFGRLSMVSGGTASDLHRTSLLNSHEYLFSAVCSCRFYWSHLTMGDLDCPDIRPARFGRFCENRSLPLMLSTENVDKTG